jgi:hypothetical protein
VRLHHCPLLEALARCKFVPDMRASRGRMSSRGPVSGRSPPSTMSGIEPNGSHGILAQGIERADRPCSHRLDSTWAGGRDRRAALLMRRRRGGGPPLPLRSAWPLANRSKIKHQCSRVSISGKQNMSVGVIHRTHPRPSISHSCTYWRASHSHKKNIVTS